MELATLIVLPIAVLASAAVYGTGVLCAVVQRAAMTRVGDRTLGITIGYVRCYGDKRMPVVGAVATVASVLSAVFAGLAGAYASTALVGSGLVAAVLWLAIARDRVLVGT